MIRIRNMEISEIEMIMELRRKHFGEFIENRFREYIAQYPASIVIADKGDEKNEILGYAFAYPWRSDSGVVHHLFAFSDNENEVEAKLLDFLERYFAEKDRENIRVWAKEEQKNLIKLLYELGYGLDTELLAFENSDLMTANMVDEGNREVEIKDFKEEFIDNLMEIESKCFKPSWHQRKEDFIRSSQRSTDWNCLAFIDNEAVGYLQVSSSENLGHLGRVAVLPRYQGKGIGTRLAAEAMRWFKKRGAYKVKLRSPVNDKIAHKLYRKFGFVEMGREFDFVKKLD